MSLFNLISSVARFLNDSLQVNGTFSCSNDKGLNGLLKGELGFPGCAYIFYTFQTLYLIYIYEDVMSGIYLWFLRQRHTLKSCVFTDWLATHATSDVNAGLDVSSLDRCFSV